MNNNIVTVDDIAKHLHVNRWTVYRWIEWYYSDLKKPEGLYLPPYKLVGVSKLYKHEDLKYFEQFQINLPFGAMREYTKYRFAKKRDKNPVVREAIKNSRCNQRKAVIKFDNK